MNLVIISKSFSTETEAQEWALSQTQITAKDGCLYIKKLGKCRYVVLRSLRDADSQGCGMIPDMDSSKKATQWITRNTGVSVLRCRDHRNAVRNESRLPSCWTRKSVSEAITKCNYCDKIMFIGQNYVACPDPDCPNHRPITIAQLWRGYAKCIELTEALRATHQKNNELIKMMGGTNER